MNECRYWILGGEALEKAEAYLASRKQQSEDAKAFAEKHEASEFLQTESLGTRRIIGVFSKTPLDTKVWSPAKNFDNGWYPSKRTKAGKAIGAELAKISHVPHGLGGEMITGGLFFVPCVYKVGDVTLLSQHKDAKNIPPDSREIKGWEAMKMIEEHNAKLKNERAEGEGK